MDARIDNREALAKELDLPSKPLERIGDSEFILAAYRKWGEECADRLLGDFAFVIWDEKKKHLFCARDIVGIKPLYYHFDNNKFVFANDIKALSESGIVDTTLDEKSIANYLANRLLTTKKDTFFKHIHKLEPASYMIITDTEIITKTYWKANQFKPNTNISEEEAIDQLQKLLYQAVENRSRTQYRLSSHLSGGIDSSPIAIIANEFQKKQSNTKPLLVFNWLYPPENEEEKNHYEWSNSLYIAQKENFEHHFVELTEEKLYDYITNIPLTYEWSNLWYEYPIREKVQQNNSRVLLSGWGGDELISHHGHAIFCDLFVNKKFTILFNELKLIASYSKKPIKRVLSTIYRRVFIPLMPTKLYCYLPKIHCTKFEFSIIHPK
jgi:asparagine synthase (glutamine-hydrolysing)